MAFSEGVSRSRERPEAVYRAVRPTRCMYDATSSGQSTWQGQVGARRHRAGYKSTALSQTQNS